SPTPCHHDGVRMVSEIGEIQLELSARLDADHSTERLGKLWFAVRGQPHDLVLVTVVCESEILGPGQVEEPQGMGESHTIERRDLVALALGDCRADDVSKAVDRGYGGRVEG